MKKIILLFALLVHVLSTEAKPTYITGYFPHSTQSALQIKVLVTDQLNRLDLTKTFTTTAIDGRFVIKFDLQRVCTFSLIVGSTNVFGDILTMALIEPADSLHFEVPNLEKSDFYSLKVTGTGSEKFLLYKELFNASKGVMTQYKHPWPINSILPIEEILKVSSTYDSTVVSKKNLNSRAISNLIVSNVKYEWYDALFAVLLDSASTNPKFKDLFLMEITKKGDLEMFLQAGVIYTLPATHVLNNYALLHHYYQTNERLTDNLRWTDPFKFYHIIGDFYREHPEVREFLLAEFIGKFIHFGKSSQVQKLFEFYENDGGKRSIFYPQMSDMISQFTANLSKGKPFINFTLRDTINKFVKLTDYKGKVIVLDFYFLGCGGCKASIPFIQKIEKKFEGTDVIFVSVSVDRNESDWKRSRNIYSSPTAIQLFTNDEGTKHPLIRFAQITSYPTFMIIDKNGNFSSRVRSVLADEGLNLEEEINIALKN